MSAAKSKVRRHTVEGRTISSQGHDSDFWQDFYHSCLTASWTKFYAAAALSFIAVNVVFALLYSLEPNGISNLAPNNFWGYFFFSVETLATVGYGDMHPQSMYSHSVATIEIFLGMTGVAVLTGLVFARFSKPTPRILFSNRLVLSTFNGEPTLMMRAANARQNQIANATAKMHVLIQEVTLEGNKIRRIYDLELVRSDQPMFFLTWTLMHTITPSSPLYGLTSDDMKAKSLIFLLRIVGFDESIAQEIHARKSYAYSDVVRDHQFEDVTITDPKDGTIHINYERFHQIRPNQPHPHTKSQAP